MPTRPNTAQRTLKLHSGVLWGFLRILGSLSAASPAGCKAAGSGANPQGGKQNGGGAAGTGGMSGPCALAMQRKPCAAFARCVLVKCEGWQQDGNGI